ncbi:ATP-dependent Clp protease ATP-binding subunit [Flavitalea sp. BT771]|uniref:ATP-dependent Clp protease ATP-binding subunit n=1 Tax=Flavitalea sp. BT771 TaxID=3063329 RepID=UPI0026E2BDC7|nr:ATP-dependent Clp protease ATP-binding subunit [Flavitalea sp. BT771]MDO6429313.1 ATP-dependent Clp protease ATP-binding subunit [Flavitalea sp. BT771]MDV6218559.1 ATP-dependent Clp protease ATP-binding subunit [Flavitalea sp. BT771]
MPTATLDIQLNAGTQKALKIAQSLAREHMHAAFGAPHLLKALLHKDLETGQQLWQHDYDVYYIEEWADVRMESYRKSPAPKEAPAGNDDIAAILEEADNVRLQLNDEEVTPLHVLIALSTPGVGFSFEQLKTFPLQREALLQIDQDNNTLRQLNIPSAANTRIQALLKFCRDKTLQAAQDGMDPIAGRQQEIRMMAEIISRRSKPNVLIIGEPGVGKSALVDGFAQAIHNGQVPDFLRNAKIFQLDNGALVAGASYKGEVEERLKSILQEIQTFDKAILFIDEIHALLDKQGAAAGAANLLKPELARGAITVIGATTLEEYRRHIEKDEAFARRFEVLSVAEPDAATAFRMIKQVLPRYEAHHRIQAEDETIKESVRLAKRYIKDRKLPDAAIDLVDRSMASLRLAIDTGADKIKKLEALIATEDEQWHLEQLRQTVGPIIWSAAAPGDDPQDLTVIYQRLKAILPLTRTSLQQQDITSIVADKTGIPVGKLQSAERERLLDMPGLLRQRVVGQSHAIHTISEAILESRSGLSKPGQPIGSFFFLGPTGTGKTELARALAELLFQDERYIIRFDMSEFKEEHAAALLYGAPPGYVGYEEGGLLVNKIRQQPYAVVLFDEIEKAHASVFDIFLQIMDEGRLHDKLGRQGDFSNALIIFTSNIASKYVAEAFAQGTAPSHAHLLDKMAAHFRPEFLGRLTEIVPFSPIDTGMVEDIFRIQLKGLHQLLKGQNIELDITPAALKHLAALGFSPDYGARPLAGIIRGQLRRPLSRMIVSGALTPGSKITLGLGAGSRLIWCADKSE